MFHAQAKWAAALLLAGGLLASTSFPVAGQEPDTGAEPAPADFVGAWPIDIPDEIVDAAPDFVPMDVDLDGPAHEKSPSASGAQSQGAFPFANDPQALAWDAGLSATGPGGVDSSSPDIVGGTLASRGEYPWQALLQRNGAFICGGSLIHPRWVLTAAHCVTVAPAYYPRPDIYTVVVGEYSRSAGDATEQSRPVIQVVVHPSYRPGNYDYDVALLELETPVTVGTAASLIPLVSSPVDDGLLQPGDGATVTGWGATSEGGFTSDILREVAVPLISNGSCASQYSGIFTITGNMLCAGFPQGQKDACQGDSGGPLVVKSTSGQWKQAGIVSFGQGCARPNRPGVYSRITALRSWIQQQVAAAGGSGTLINPRFDSGPGTGWSEFSAKGFNNIMNTGLPISPRSPTYLAWLGGANGESASVTQPIAFGHRAREVTYYFYVNSNENTCGLDVARAGLAISTPGGSGPQLVPVRSNLIPLCNANEAAGWRKGVISLSGLEGYPQLFIFFDVSTNGSNVSSLFVDDVARTDNPIPPLALNSFTPGSGMMGSLVTIQGNGFLNTSQVLFGGKPGLYMVDSDTQLRVRAPFNVTTSKVQITTAYGSVTSGQNFAAQSTSSLNRRAMIPALLR